METNASITRTASNAHDALDRAASAAASAAEAVHRAVDKAAGVAVPAADWISAKAGVLRETPQKLASGSREIVANHPWKAVGAAVLLGLLLSRILR